MINWLKKLFGEKKPEPEPELPPGIYPPACKCGQREWLEGPSGGCSTNVKCVHCGAVYNWSAFCGTMIGFDFIGQEKPEDEVLRDSRHPLRSQRDHPTL